MGLCDLMCFPKSGFQPGSQRFTPGLDILFPCLLSEAHLFLSEIVIITKELTKIGLKGD